MDSNNNFIDGHYDYCLDTTDLNLEGDSDDDDGYDDYHDYRCAETTLCYFHGAEVYVDVDNLDGFIYVNSENEYHHKDDVTQCNTCGKWVIKKNATYNPEVEAYFCDDTCERDYIKENFYYSEYDDDYFRNEEDVTTIQTWDEETQNYKSITISCLSRDHLIREGKAFGAGDTWFATAA